MAKNNPNLQRRLTNPAAEFIENHVKLGEPCVVSYMGELDTFLAEPDVKEQEVKSQALWQDVQAEKDRLFRSMEAVQNRLRKKFPEVGELKLHACTWSQVMDEYKCAEKCYRDESLRGHRGKIKQCLRKIGESAPVFHNWIGLLPAGDYGSSICGAFKLALSAASRLHDIRECVYEALRDIPNAIQIARRYVEIYRMEEPYKLKQETAELYKVILIALRYIMEFFTENSGKKVFNALVFQDNYEEKLTKSVQEVKDLTIKIRDDAILCSQERQRKMDDKLKDVSVEQKVQSQVLQSLWGEQRLQRQVLENLHRHLLSHPGLSPSTREPLDVKEELHQSDSSEDQIEAPIPIKSKPIKSKTSKSSAMHTEWLVDILVYDEVCIQKDITICRGLGGTMSNAEKDYASFVATSEKLRLWLTEPTRSCALVIKGAFKHNVSISPLSFLCAEISHLYGAIPNTIAIGHFCSLHVDSWQNPRANARGMMASLLGQLLSFREGFDLSFIDKQMIQDAKNDDIRVFCKIFRHLVAQMPKRSTLFCFVDTISIYETSQRLDETRIAFQTLANLLDPRGKSATFKLLVTSPGRSIPIEKYISDENIMVVPDFIDGDRHGVINLSYIQAEKM